MNRKVIVILAVSLLVGTLAVPVQACLEHNRKAQSDGPPPQTTVHIVQRGETLFSIGQRYGSTVDAITHANTIPDPRQIYVGQRIVIPGVAGEVGVQETAPYVVQAGDTLASIARRYHTTWQALAQTNSMLSPNGIYAGQVIKVPALNVPADLPVDEEVTHHPSVGGGTIYVVRSDDTLFRIAMRYDVSPWTLASVSGIANPALIYPGQELVIPNSEPGLLPEPFAFIEVQPLPVTQGTATIIAVHTTEPVVLEGRLFGQEVRFAEEGGVYYGLAGVHVFTEPGLYELELTAVDTQGQATVVDTGVVVEAGSFGYERIDVPAGRTSLLNPAIIAAERERLSALRHTFTAERQWTTPFQRPCVGAISSYYGAHRAYSDGPYTSYHSGVDFRAPGGTPVYAPAAGTVVLADALTVRGNVVLIDHGWGVLTGYWHLSTIEAQMGQRVARGEMVGKVGNTGLSTGAHLHWEVWVGGISVDGLQWLEEFYPLPEPEWLAVGG